MGSCSGKSIETKKKYAGYPTTSSRNRAGSVSCKQPEVVNTQRTEIRPAFRLDAQKLQELHSHDMRVLVRLMNNENPEISESAYQLICGISIDEFTGTMAVTQGGIKGLSKMLEAKCDSVLVECITAMHTLVQQDEDLTVDIYISCVDKLVTLLRRETADLLSCVISLMGLMTAVDDILCDMIDKGIHELLADTFHATSDVVVKRQIFLTLHNFMTIKNSEKAMHMKVIQILVETLQKDDQLIDPDIRISALRILSYAAMSGSESLQNMIGELGGVGVLLKFVRASSFHGRSMREPVQIAAMALSGLCCSPFFQGEILHEWGVDSMLAFVEENLSETSVVLAVVMGINSLLGNEAVNAALRSHPTLKRQLIIIQQQTDNEDLQDECIEALSKLMNADNPQIKFEKLCMQHFSPSASLMHQRGNLSESSRRKLQMTQNWLLSPEKRLVSSSPRRTLFPRKLNLFSSPKSSTHTPFNESFSPNNNTTTNNNNTTYYNNNNTSSTYSNTSNNFTNTSSISNNTSTIASSRLKVPARQKKLYLFSPQKNNFSSPSANAYHSPSRPLVSSPFNSPYKDPKLTKSQ